MPGEELHVIGADGARRARRWLELTTRAHAPWVNPESKGHLAFKWAGGGEFSFDVGGFLRGEDIEGKRFYAEVKLYAEPHDQGTLYKEFLAKCYRAYTLLPGECDVFMWITWAPFLIKGWGRLRSAEFVRECVDENLPKVFPDGSADDNADQTAGEVASRLWVIVLSEQQEREMILTPVHRGVVEGYIARQAAL